MKYYIKKHQINDIQIDEIVIENDTNFKVSLLNYGASIYSIHLNDLLLTASLKDLNFLTFNGSSFGKTIGRIAGRIEDGVIKIDEKEYRIEKNCKGLDTLHCGKNNFAYQTFDYQIIENLDEIKIIFTFVSKEKEAILPGDVSLNVIYSIKNNVNTIMIEYDAISSKNTYLNITNHTFYNLSGNFKEGIENHYLMINSKKKILTDERLNSKEVVKCSENFDFSTKSLLKNKLFTKEVLFRPHKGFDDAFLLEKNNDLAASLYSPLSNITLNLYTSYPGLVLYTSSYPPFMDLITETKDKFMFDTICLEAQYIPNGYKIMGKNYMYLKKGEHYNHFIKLEFLNK